MIDTDIAVIGAGPTGLFTVFEAGLLGMRCHLIDSLSKPGGQCSEIYPNKPIYDIPAYPEILAGELVDKLLEQIKPFSPGYSLGETAEELSKEDDKFILTTDKKTKISAKVIAIAGGLGNFEPRKPKLENLEKYEDNGVQYGVLDPEKFRNKSVIISGGGDSALDWTIVLSEIAKKVTLIHRRNQFRGAVDSVNKIQKLKDKGILEILTPAVISKLHGDKKLEIVEIEVEDKTLNLATDYLIPLYGLAPKMDVFKSWGLEIDKNAIKVNNSLDYQTNKNGIYAIGDINTYPGKLKLILSGFHEAAIMCHSAFQIVNPGKKNVLKYTTVSGISGFDGSKKEPKKTEINSFK